MNQNLLSVLTCSNCGNSSLTASEKSLYCKKCNAEHKKDPVSQFYNFNDQVEQQDRSLLEHQDQDFYTNDAFKEFSIQLNMKSLKKVIENLKPDFFVDVGCGSGGHCNSFRNHYQNYIGLEPSTIPAGLEIKEALADNILLLKIDPSLSYPLKQNSIDLVAFIASYDHIPDPEAVIQDLWAKLRPGGHMVINMTNYGYWLKRLVNFITKKELYKHDDEHYCVHSVETLKSDILRFIPDAKLVRVEADDRHLPNLPAKLAPLYVNATVIKIYNGWVKFLIKKILQLKNSGAEMILVFQKPN